MIRAVNKTWVITYYGGSWELSPFHMITVLSNDREVGSSRIKFDMSGPSGSPETFYAIVPSRDVELYTDVVST